MIQGMLSLKHDQLYCHKAVASLTNQFDNDVRGNMLVNQSKYDLLINNKDIKNEVFEDFDRLGISNNPERFQLFTMKTDWKPVGELPYPQMPE